jgi:hypothetical protein
MFSLPVLVAAQHRGQAGSGGRGGFESETSPKNGTPEYGSWARFDFGPIAVGSS